MCVLCGDLRRIDYLCALYKIVRVMRRKTLRSMGKMYFHGIRKEKSLIIDQVIYLLA